MPARPLPRPSVPRPTMADVVDNIVRRSADNSFHPQFLIDAAKEAAFTRPTGIADWNQLTPKILQLREVICSAAASCSGREICRMVEVLALLKPQHQREMPVAVIDAILRMMSALCSRAAEPIVLQTLTARQAVQLLRGMRLVGLTHESLQTALRDKLPTADYVALLGPADLAAEATVVAKDSAVDFRLMDAIGDRAARRDVATRLRGREAAALLTAFVALRRSHDGLLNSVAARLDAGFAKELTHEEASVILATFNALSADHPQAINALHNRLESP